MIALGLIVKVGDWLISSQLGRRILLAAAGLLAVLQWRRSIVADTRREIKVQADRRVNEAQRRMLDATARGPVTDDDLVARLRRGGGL